MANFFFDTYRFFSLRKWIFWGGIVVLLSLLALVASRISFEEDISKLIPQTSENKTLQQVLATANFSDKIIIHLQKSETGTIDDLTEYATACLDSLNANFENYIQEVQGVVPDDAALETLDFVYDNLPLFLNEADYERIQQKLNTDSIYQITKTNYETLVSPTGLLAKKSIARDPLGISFMGMQQLKELGANANFTIKNGFLVSEDEQHLLLFITPKNTTSETAANQTFVANLYALQEHLNNQFQQKVTASVFGGVLIAVANAQQIKTDIQYTVGISVLVLLVVFILFYRKLAVPLILFTPTVFGGLLAVAFLAVFRGEISAISLGIGSVLLGVTLDYSLHILTHLRNGEQPKTLFASVAKPIIMSSLSTAAAFLCLLFIDAQAIQDLGIFAAISVLGASVFSLVFIPQSYATQDGTNKKSTRIDAVAGYPFHKNKIILVVLVLLLVTSVFTYNKVRFNKDISALNFIPKQLQQAETELDTVLNTKAKSLYVVAYGEKLETALEANDAVLQSLQHLKAENKLLQYNSVGSLMPSEKNQRLNIRRWSDFWSSQRVDSLSKLLGKSGAAFGFKPTSFQQFFTTLSNQFEPLALSDVEEFSLLNTKDFITKKENFTTVTSLVKVSEVQVNNVKKAFNTEDNIIVIDRKAINETLLGKLKKQFNKLILYSFLVVLLLLLVFYRNIKETLVTIIPILVTWCITIALMGLVGLEFNVFNVIVTTFIFGLGIDYSIFMTNGLKYESQGIQLLTSNKTSILLSVLTTILGMGVLIFAKHPALQSIALVAVIGIGTAMLVSFTIQPLLYRLLIFKERKRYTL